MRRRFAKSRNIGVSLRPYQRRLFVAACVALEESSNEFLRQAVVERIERLLTIGRLRMADARNFAGEPLFTNGALEPAKERHFRSVVLAMAANAPGACGYLGGHQVEKVRDVTCPDCLAVLHLFIDDPDHPASGTGS